MLSVNLTMTIIVLIVIFMAFPLLLQVTVRMRCAGKMLCGLVLKGKPLEFKMKKIEEGEFVREGTDKWFIRDTQVKLVDYPLMWPRILGMFKQTVPCSLYTPGRAEPLDWEDPASGSMSSKELAVILDPYWLRALVAGVTAEGGFRPSRWEKALPILTVAFGLISMVLLFLVLTKL